MIGEIIAVINIRDDSDAESTFTLLILSALEQEGLTTKKTR
jgi:hypothetical protein